jgi:hypothetical protein
VLRFSSGHQVRAVGDKVETVLRGGRASENLAMRLESVEKVTAGWLSLAFTIEQRLEWLLGVGRGPGSS